MSAAYAASVAIAALALFVGGTGHRGIILGLMMTARWSYCYFLPAYVGGGLATLFGPLFQPIARRGRDLGLAFASAHLTHFCLVAWLYYISPTPPVPRSSAIFFGIALVLTYALALFSLPRLSAQLHPRVWWLLRTVGMDYIAFAFLSDFLHDPFNGSLVHLIGYLPFVALGLSAALVRLAAYAVRLRRWLMPQPAAGTAGSAAGGTPAASVAGQTPFTRRSL